VGTDANDVSFTANPNQEWWELSDMPDDVLSQFHSQNLIPNKPYFAEVNAPKDNRVENTRIVGGWVVGDDGFSKFSITKKLGSSDAKWKVEGTKLNFPAIAPCLKRDVEVDSAAASKDTSAPENSEISNNELTWASSLPATLRRMLLSLRPFSVGNYEACIWRSEPHFPTTSSTSMEYIVRVFARNKSMFLAIEATQEIQLTAGTTEAQAKKMISTQPWASRVVRSSL
jgi:hypothetical protein